MRTDSIDRFGTPLGRRFSRIEIENMLINVGLVNIRFSKSASLWHTVVTKAKNNVWFRRGFILNFP